MARAREVPDEVEEPVLCPGRHPRAGQELVEPRPDLGMVELGGCEAADHALAAEIPEDLEHGRVVLEGMEAAGGHERIVRDADAVPQLGLVLGGDDERLERVRVGGYLGESVAYLRDLVRAEDLRDHLRGAGEDLGAVPQAGEDVPVRERAGFPVEAERPLVAEAEDTLPRNEDVIEQHHRVRFLSPRVERVVLAARLGRDGLPEDERESRCVDRDGAEDRRLRVRAR